MFGFRENLLANFAKMDKVYRRLCFDAVRDLDEFTQNEVLVLMFLTNPDNAPMDTATDISVFRSVSKGMVARSVESLSRRGYLRQRRDERDRRVVHLIPTEQCEEAGRRFAEVRQAFTRRMERGLSTADRKVMERVSCLFEQNLAQLMEGKEEI